MTTETKTPKTTTVALCGNPNSGKTTLFNLLTGSNQSVGNRPGVTVEQKSGVYVKNKTIAVVDTPGTYSLSPFTPEEQVTINYLSHGDVDVVVNTVDCVNLTRSLYLTSQLVETGVTVVVALNMADEASKKGICINKEVLERAFGCRFFFISASQNMGVDELMQYCAEAVPQAKRTANFGSSAKQRYERIEEIVAKARKAEKKEKSLTERIDDIVLNKWLAFPIFALVMFAVFYLSVGGIGKLLSQFLSQTVAPRICDAATYLLRDAPQWLRSLAVDGMLTGVLSVAGFVPQIMLLFGCIAVLESCGYMSRIAFITDRLLRKIGLGGKSFVAIILGCGCSVPAIMSARTIKSRDERNRTITLAPFVPCSAKMAIISFFTANVMGGNALFAVSFYFVGILTVVAGGLLLKLFGKRYESDDVFIMELPPYRTPTFGNVWKQMYERGKAFLVKSGTTILAASVVLWFLQSFDPAFRPAEAENSILAAFGKAIAPIFTPLGFGKWQFAVATLSGIAAKETVVTTLQILYPHGLAMGGLAAYSFVTYNLLTVPCVAAVAASFAEQGFAKGLKSAAFQFAVAYVVSLIIYQAGRLASRNRGAFAVVAGAIVAAVVMCLAIKTVVTHRRSAKPPMRTTPNK